MSIFPDYFVFDVLKKADSKNEKDHLICSPRHYQVMITYPRRRSECRRKLIGILSRAGLARGSLFALIEGNQPFIILFPYITCQPA